MALGGGREIPEKPVRDGSKKGTVMCDLGDIIVTRSITEKGGGQLIIKDKDGKKYSSPQTLLDSLVGKLQELQVLPQTL